MKTLRIGAVGPEVKKLQTLLFEKGFTVVGRPDGQFGKLTLTAVQQFQQSKGLNIDGIVGPNTWAALGVSSQSIIPSNTITTTASMTNKSLIPKTVNALKPQSAFNAFFNNKKNMAIAGVAVAAGVGLIFFLLPSSTSINKGQ